MSLAHNQTKKRVYEKVFMGVPTNNDLMHFFIGRNRLHGYTKNGKLGDEHKITPTTGAQM
jgi:hypothetical protein